MFRKNGSVPGATVTGDERGLLFHGDIYHCRLSAAVGTDNLMPAGFRLPKSAAD
jgi:hypothetical protein